MELIVDKLGRLVIPKDVRDHYQLGPGSVVRLEEIPGGIVLIPVSDHGTLEQRDGLLVHTGVPDGDLEVERILKAVQAERDLRNSGLNPS
jgi:AbrB family looped-hinge helix DNA binding protein